MLSTKNPRYSRYQLRHFAATLIGLAALSGHGASLAVDLFVDPSGTDQTNCSDENDPCATIAHVLSQTVAGDRVFLAPFNTASSSPGIGIPGLPGAGKNLACSFANPTIYTEHNLSSTEEIEIIGGGRACTVIDAQGADRILTLVKGGSVSNITFANGSASGSAGYGNGGAIMAWWGSLTIKDSRFENNQANFGGAVATDASVDKLTIRGSVFVDNSADDAGGAVFCSLCPQLTIANSRFSRNSTNWLGGAVYFGTGDDNADPDGQPEDITIRRSRFIDNTSEYFGGAVSIDSPEGHTTLINNSLFQGNSVKDNDGGAIYAYNGSLTVDGSTFEANSADDSEGGAIAHIGEQGLLNAYNSTFSRNTADRGGAIHLGTETRAYLASSTLLGNSASDPGYGDHISGNCGYLNIYQSIIADDPTGAIPADRACQSTATIGTGGRNLIADGTCGSWAGFNQGVANGVDADLSPGNSPATVHDLLPGSNAIDSGGSSALQCVEFATPSFLTSDQRGLSRFRDGDGDGVAQCDIGSVERQNP